MLISKGLTLLLPNYRSANRTECENEMIDLDLSQHLEVQINILNEQKAEREKFERGVQAMLNA